MNWLTSRPSLFRAIDLAHWSARLSSWSADTTRFLFSGPRAPFCSSSRSISSIGHENEPLDLRESSGDDAGSIPLLFNSLANSDSSGSSRPATEVTTSDPQKTYGSPRHEDPFMEDLQRLTAGAGVVTPETAPEEDSSGGTA